MTRTVPPTKISEFDDILIFDVTERNINIPYEISVLIQFLTRQKNSDAVALYLYYLFQITYLKNSNKIHCPWKKISEDLNWPRPNKIIKARKALEAIGLIKMWRLPGNNIKRRCVTKINNRISLKSVEKILKKHDPTLTKTLINENVNANKLLRSNNYINNTSQVASDIATRSIVDKKKNEKTYPNKYQNLVKRIRKIHISNERINRELSNKDILSQSDTIDKLVRLDKYDFNTQIKPCLIWAANHHFWSANFLSCNSLRTRKSNDLSKFDKMYAQFKKDTVKQLKIDCPFDDNLIAPVLDYIKNETNTQKQQIFDNVQLMLDWYEDNVSNSIMASSLLNNTLFTDGLIGFSGHNRFVRKFVEFIKEQDWIENPSPALLHPQKQLFQKYIKMIEDEILQKF